MIRLIRLEDGRFGCFSCNTSNRCVGVETTVRGARELDKRLMILCEDCMIGNNGLVEQAYYYYGFDRVDDDTEDEQ